MMFGSSSHSTLPAGMAGSKRVYQNVYVLCDAEPVHYLIGWGREVVCVAGVVEGEVEFFRIGEDEYF